MMELTVVDLVVWIALGTANVIAAQLSMRRRWAVFAGSAACGVVVLGVATWLGA